MNKHKSKKKNPNYMGAIIVLAGAILLIGMGFAIGRADASSTDLSERIEAFTKSCSDDGGYYVISTKEGDPTVCYDKYNNFAGSLSIQQVPHRPKLFGEFP